EHQLTLAGGLVDVDRHQARAGVAGVASAPGHGCVTDLSKGSATVGGQPDLAGAVVVLGDVEERGVALELELVDALAEVLGQDGPRAAAIGGDGDVALAAATVHRGGATGRGRRAQFVRLGAVVERVAGR